MTKLINKMMIGLMLFAAVGVAQADIFNDDFESLNSAATIGGQGGWTTTGTDVSGQNAFVAAAVQSPIDGGTKSLRILDASTDTSKVTAQNIFGATTTAGAVISFDFRGDAFTSSRSVFTLLGRNAANGFVGAIILNLQDGNDATSGEVANWSGGTWGTIGYTLAATEWYRFELTLGDVAADANDTYDLSILNTSGAVLKSATNLEFNQDIVSFEGVRFGQQNGTTQTDTLFYVDNVNVIPEPVALGMISMASIGILFARRIMQIG